MKTFTSLSYEQSELQMPQARNCMDYFRRMFLADLPDDLKKSCWIAGGAVKDWFEHGYVKNDVDFWCVDRTAMYLLTRYLRRNYEFRGFLFTKNAIKGYVTIKGRKINVDVVKKPFMNPLDSIERFDFTICCFGVSSDNFYYHTSAPFDLLKKKIVVNNISDPVDSMRRLVKYINKGYKTCNGTILTISKEIAQMDSTDESIFDFYKFD